MVAALASGRSVSILRAYFGDEYDELRALARRADKARPVRGPRVYLLPGIMGSTLGYRDRAQERSIWLDPHAIASGELLQLALPSSATLRPLGVMLPGYLQLQLRLRSAGFDAVLHPFDWRKSVMLSAKQLQKRIATERKKSVALIGHSMGGLVARAALALDDRRRIDKVVQLGAPNLGSFAPIQALRAVYASVRKIAALDPRHSAEQLSRHIFRSLPGLYDLLPGDFWNLERWPEDLLVPDAMLFDQARRTRKRLASARPGCYHIVGVGRETVIAAVKRRGGFEYTLTKNGDGTVPRELAEWPGAQSFFVSELHGCLTKNAQIASAIVDLLRTGGTKRLPTAWRDADNRVVQRVLDTALRRELRAKVRWDKLPVEERRNLLSPVISAEFRTLSRTARSKST